MALRQFHPLHTVTLSDTLIIDEEIFKAPPFLALDAQDGVVRSCALRGSCGDGARVDRRRSWRRNRQEAGGVARPGQERGSADTGGDKQGEPGVLRLRL